MIELAAAALISIAGPLTGAMPKDAARVAAVEVVVASTTRVWAAHQPGYQPPRLTFLRPPIGHPARGSGYHPAAGVVVDLGDLEVLETHFRDEAPTLINFLIAHEVGHHVQTQAKAPGRMTSAQREWQADCYAGWWIAQARRDAGPSVASDAVLELLDLRLPQMLRILSVLRTGNSSSSSDPTTHGDDEVRRGALERGLSAQSPESCLPS